MDIFTNQSYFFPRPQLRSVYKRFIWRPGTPGPKKQPVLVVNGVLALCWPICCFHSIGPPTTCPTMINHQIWHQAEEVEKKSGQKMQGEKSETHRERGSQQATHSSGNRLDWSCSMAHALAWRYSGEQNKTTHMGERHRVREEDGEPRGDRKMFYK